MIYYFQTVFTCRPFPSLIQSRVENEHYMRSLINTEIKDKERKWLQTKEEWRLYKCLWSEQSRTVSRTESFGLWSGAWPSIDRGWAAWWPASLRLVVFWRGYRSCPQTRHVETCADSACSGPRGDQPLWNRKPGETKVASGYEYMLLLQSVWHGHKIHGTYFSSWKEISKYIFYYNDTLTFDLIGRKRIKYL